MPRSALATLEFSAHLVDDCSTVALDRAAERPAYSVLGTERGQRLPPHPDALRRFGVERQLFTAGPKPATETNDLRQLRPSYPGTAA